MAFKYPECEFCANHRQNHAVCDECDEGDCFEDIESRRHATQHMQARRKTTTAESTHSIQSILKEYP